jgi:uncharacterized small protein (DUF1192 family)
MSLFDEDKPIKKVTHEIGADLSALSADELNARIALLREEIGRIETEVAAKSSSRNTAESLFKK